MRAFSCMQHVAAFGIVAMSIHAGAARAQLQSGNLYGTVTDTEGRALAGVRVTLSGVGRPQTHKTNEKGHIRYIGLPPGTYRLEADLEGYSPVVFDAVDIRIGRNTALQLQMSSVLEETVTVTAEPPPVSPGRHASPHSMSFVELEELPISLDPWSVAAQAPGVLLDRVDVGGSSGGEQPLLVGMGTGPRENALAVDGVVITEMASGAFSPGSVDLGQLKEVQIGVGGSDSALESSGLLVNLITKRAGNQWRGSARVFLTRDGWQASPNVSESELPPAQTELPFTALRGLSDYGLEAGGRIVRDRLWLWSSLGIQEIGRDTRSDSLERLHLGSSAIKLNADATPANTAVAALNRVGSTRSAIRSGLQHAGESIWNQEGNLDLLRLEDSHLCTSELFVTARYSIVDSDLTLDPLSGGAGEAVWDADGVWRGGLANQASRSTAEQWELSGGSYVGFGLLKHELKFGASNRQVSALDRVAWGSRDLLHIAKENLGSDFDVVEALRRGESLVERESSALWVQDTATFGEMALSIGGRYDVQRGRIGASHSSANATFSDLLPALVFTGDASSFDWEMISPRVGLGYSPRKAPSTVLRASLSRFPAQLSSGLIGIVDPVASTRVRYGFEDLDSDNIFDDGEPFFLLQAFGVDPANPADPHSANLIDPRLQPEVIDELALGVEHSVKTTWVLGVSLVYRHTFNILESRMLIHDQAGELRLARRDDYHLDSLQSAILPGGEVIDVPVFALDPELEYAGGSWLTNGDRQQDFAGATVSFNKRLANRWMLRGHATRSDWQWRIGSEFRRFDDPNDTVITAGELPTGGTPSVYSGAGGPPTNAFIDLADTDGQLVVTRSGGSDNRSQIFLNSGWSFGVSGLYQVAPDRPWGFTVAANIRGREGFPVPYSIRVAPEDLALREIQVTPWTEALRLDDVVTTDLRVEKEIQILDLATTLSLDVFNLFNQGVVLQRVGQLNSPQSDFVQEIQSPRVFRLAIRAHWR